LLTLVEQDDFGVCGVECKTISKAAEEIVGDADTDIAEALWKVPMLCCLSALKYHTSILLTPYNKFDLHSTTH